MPEAPSTPVVPDRPELHEHEYTEVVTAPTCFEPGYTTYNCSCGHSYTGAETDPAHDAITHVAALAATCDENGNIEYWFCETCGSAWLDEACMLNTNLRAVVLPATGHADEDGNYKCDGCSTKMLPEAGAALTVAQAKTIALLMGDDYTTDKYYVTGIISSVANTQYGNMTIVDATGADLYLYGLYSADGSVRYDAMATKPVKGDEITVYTVLGCHYGSPQGKSAWLDELVQHTEHVWADATCTSPKTCILCDATEGEPTGHVYVDGVCACGKEEGSAALENATISFANTAQRTEFSTSKQVWVQNGITVTNDKASSSSNVADYANPVRFYASSKVTVEGAGMTVIKFTCSESKYATNLNTSIGTVAGATVTVSGSVVTVTFDEAVDSFVIAKLSAQVRISSITVNP